MAERAGAAAGVALFALAFALGVAAAGRVLTPPSDPEVELKLAVLREQLDEVDTLFVGSSRFLRGVAPRAFDRVMAARGHPTRSFNLAMQAMRPHESNRLLRRVLAWHPPALRFVFLDLMDWEPLLERANRFTPRATAWHDWSETVSVLRSTLRSELPTVDRLELAATHLLHWASFELRVGRGAAALRPEPVPGGPARDLLVRRRGFVPFTPAEYEEGITGSNRRAFEASLDEYRRTVAGLARANAAPVSLESWNVPALRAQVAAIRAAGAEPIHVLPPVGEATPALYRLAEAGHVPVLLAFDPVLHPELFAEDVRFDGRHLAREGPELFTRALARRFAAWLDSR